jgi:hypothetical protein
MAGIAQIWVWTVGVAPRGGDQMPDITGYEVSARDGNIGNVEEVFRGADGRSCVVVDTGWWIFEKKRMIPAGAIDTVDHDARRINVGMTKDEIKDAPDYEAERRDEQQVRQQHEDYYGSRAATRR